MGKFFRRKHRYSDEDYEGEWEDDELDNDEELDDEDSDDNEELEDDEDSDDNEELEDDEDSDDDEELEDDKNLDDDAETDDDSADDEEIEEEDPDEGEEIEEDSENEELMSGDNDSDDGEELEDSDEDPDDEDDEDSDEDDEYEEEEDERRLYRRKRRIRNQIISYSVVFIILAVIVTGGVILGKNIANAVKEKKLAEEQIILKEQQEAEAAHDVVIDAPESMVEEIPEVDYLGELIEKDIANMPLADKVAGLFIVTPEALTGVKTATQAGDGTKDALAEYAVGGLIYFDQNIIDKEQITEMLSSTMAKSKYPVFLAVDEEGGSVSRVAKSGIEVIQVGDMAEIGASGDAAQAYEAGLNIGSYLKDLGFNLDFAPVADVAGSEDSALGNRVFGSDAQLVADMVSNAVDGIEGTGVSSCLKHFPGLGDTTADTHDGRVEITKTLDEMRESDFVPFRAGIEAGADFVMVSHATMAADEDAVPSSLSKSIMTDVLRNELGFQGVIITDALNMGAITEYYTSQEAAVMAVEAGADMLLMPEDFTAAYDALLTAVQEGTIPEERIDESLRRIYRIKYADELE